MVRDVKVSAGCVVAYMLWVAALAVWGLGLIVDSAPVRGLSFIVCCSAATATVRTYFVRQNQIMRDHYEMGRDSAASVTAMRR